MPVRLCKTQQLEVISSFNKFRDLEVNPSTHFFRLLMFVWLGFGNGQHWICSLQWQSAGLWRGLSYTLFRILAWSTICWCANAAFTIRTCESVLILIEFEKSHIFNLFICRSERWVSIYPQGISKYRQPRMPVCMETPFCQTAWSANLPAGSVIRS